MLVWDTHQANGRQLEPMARLKSKDIKVAIVQANPRYNMIATADSKVCMWVPGENVRREDL